MPPVQEPTQSGEPQQVKLTRRARFRCPRVLGSVGSVCIATLRGDAENVRHVPLRGGSAAVRSVASTSRIQSPAHRELERGLVASRRDLRGVGELRAHPGVAHRYPRCATSRPARPHRARRRADRELAAPMRGGEGRSHSSSVGSEPIRSAIRCGDGSEARRERQRGAASRHELGGLTIRAQHSAARTGSAASSGAAVAQEHTVRLFPGRRKDVEVHRDDHRNEHDGVVEEVQLHARKQELKRCSSGPGRRRGCARRSPGLAAGRARCGARTGCRKRSSTRCARDRRSRPAGTRAREHHQRIAVVQRSDFTIQGSQSPSTPRASGLGQPRRRSAYAWARCSAQWASTIAREDLVGPLVPGAIEPFEQARGLAGGLGTFEGGDSVGHSACFEWKDTPLASQGAPWRSTTGRARGTWRRSPGREACPRDEGLPTSFQPSLAGM